MRRTDRQRTDQEFMASVLNTADEIYVGFSTGDFPYVLPFNFIYLNEKIYIHCALEGRKLDCIKADPRIGFCAATNIEILREKSTTAYQSICGTGKAYVIDNVDEKRAALDAIALRYAAHCEMPATEKMISRTAIIRIEIEDISGKQSPAAEVKS